MDDQPMPRPLTRTILLNWKSAIRAMGRIGILAIITIILLTVAGLIASIASSSLLQAPLLVAFYRRLLLELPIGLLGDPRTTLVFAAWSAIVSLVLVGFGIPSLLRITVLAAPATFVGLFVQIRLILLLPAIAIGRTRGAPTLSWQATRGRFWWLLVGSFATSSPAWLPAVPITLLPMTRYAHLVDRSILNLLLQLFGVVSLLLGAAFAAQVYADRIGPVSRSPTAP